MNTSLKKGHALLAFSLLAGIAVNAQDRYRKEADKLEASIERNFYDASSGYYKEHAEPERNEHPASYLWPLCGMIQADNELEVLSGEKRIDRSMSIIAKYYDTRKPAPGYASYPVPLGGGDRFYDDNQWIGIALMDAYFRTKNTTYLEKSREIYRYMMTAYDTATGGGLYWQEGKLTSKNTCSNGPGIILALQMYKATKDKKLLDTALMLYKWVNKYLRDKDGLYYDNIHVPGKKIDQRRYSYNTGTMMQSNLYLYELTGEKKYLSEAKVIAESSSKYFLGSGAFRDTYWFNAVLLRAYQHLLKFDKDRKYIQAFSLCVDNALTKEVHPNGLLGAKNKTADLVGQSGMLEILARLALLEK